MNEQQPLLIDWVLDNISFKTTPHMLSSPPMSLPLQASASLATPSSIPHKESLKLEALKIALVNVATFACIHRMDSTEVFQLSLFEVTAKAYPMISDASIDLTSIPKEYHNFPDVFSKG